MAKVEFRHIAKRFENVEAVRDMNLTIEDGEFVALLGPSGCGKSTSLFMLAGIYLPSSGELLFDGRVVQRGRGQRPQCRYRFPVLCSVPAYDRTGQHPF